MAKATDKKLLIIIIAAIALIIAAATQTASYINLNAIEKAQENSQSCEILPVNKNLSIKSQPLGISFPIAKANEGDEIKVLASSEKWSRVIITKGNKIKSGYIKTDKISAADGGFVPIKSIAFSLNEATASIGTPLELSLQLYPEGANETIQWLSSDEAIATAENGVVTPIKEGCATITAKSANCEKKIKINIVKKGERLLFKADGILTETDRTPDLSSYFTEAVSGDVKYELLNPELAKIQNGRLIPLSAGKTVLTATNGVSTAQCTLEIRKISGHSDGPLSMPNAYGNNIDYHPGVVFFKEKWNGYKYWLAHTPYPGHNDRYENPHIMASNDLVNWEEPKGFKNPLEPAPANYEHGISYNSDTELVYNSDTDTLECWWRFYDKPGNRFVIFKKTTTDGVHWSDKEIAISSDDMTTDYLSPSVLYEDGIYKMWSVSGKGGNPLEYRESKDGKIWSEPRTINFTYEDKDLRNWHFDIIHTERGYEISMSGSSVHVRGRNDMSVYYSYSPDNINYTPARPMLNPQIGKNAWDNKGHYRSSLVYFDGTYHLFYSGLNTVYGASGIGHISGSTPFNMK